MDSGRYPLLELQWVANATKDALDGVLSEYCLSLLGHARQSTDRPAKGATDFQIAVNVMEVQVASSDLSYSTGMPFLTILPFCLSLEGFRHNRIIDFCYTASSPEHKAYHEWRSHSGLPALTQLCMPNYAASLPLRIRED